MEDLSYLINLAPGPNPSETDWVIFRELVTERFVGQPYARLWREEQRISFEDAQGFIHHSEFEIPNITQSLDEAIALAESSGYLVVLLEAADDGYSATLKYGDRTVRGTNRINRALAVVSALANAKVGRTDAAGNAPWKRRVNAAAISSQGQKVVKLHATDNSDQ